MCAHRPVRAVVSALVLACLAPGAAAAQRPADSRWLPWLGCWVPVAEPGSDPSARGDATARTPAFLVCVRPAADGAGIVVATVHEGEEVARRALKADGVQREVEVEGCAGWERARWSADGGRVFYRSLLTCEGGVRRESSGATMMLASGDWLDAEVVRAGDARTLEVRRYRFATDQEHRAHGREPPAGNALALETARKAAAATLSVGDVIEAASEVDEQVVQALLADYGGRFPLDAEALVRLADAGVSARTIDLMIALSFPDRFAVNRTALAADFRAPEPAAAPVAGDALRGYPSSYVSVYGYGPGCYGFRSPWRIGFYPGSLRYGRPYAAGYGYSGCADLWPRYRRWDGLVTDPIVIVERKPDAGGRAVPGGGYTRRSRDDSKGKARPRAGGSRIGPERSAVAPSSGGGATRGGYEAGSSTGEKGSSGSSGRKAKPRGS
jgi:hypothetical protein